MKETAKHLEAFEQYYQYSEDRSLARLAADCHIATATAKMWSKAFNWQERIQERDKANALQVQARVDKHIVAKKAKYIEQVDLNLEHVQAILDKARELDTIEVKTVSDLANLVRAQVMLINLQMRLLGEDTEGTTIDIQVHYV